MQNEKYINEYDDEIDLRELFSALESKNSYYQSYCSFFSSVYSLFSAQSI